MLLAASPVGRQENMTKSAIATEPKGIAALTTKTGLTELPSGETQGDIDSVA